MLPVILLHELGHAVMALLVGFELFILRIGSGKALFAKRLHGVSLKIGRAPFGGLTICAGAERGEFRLRWFLVILGGPLANLLCSGAILSALGPDHLFRLDPIRGRTDLPYLLFWLNAMALVMSLYPRSVWSEFGPVDTDGRQLWQLIVSKAEHADDRHRAYFLCQVHRALEGEDFGAAHRWLAKGLDHYADHPALLSTRGVILLGAGHLTEAREQFTAVQTRQDLEGLARALNANNLAYANALLGSTDLLEEADRLSREAHESAGDLPHILSTRGAVLVRRGDPRRGLSLLKRSLRGNHDPKHTAETLAWIAIGESILGDCARAEKTLAAARKLAPGWARIDHLATQVERRTTDARNPENIA